VSPTEERPPTKKEKNDASKALGERTKKQRDTPRALQVGYTKHEEQPLSVMSHTYRDFFGFVALPSYERTQTATDKKCYNLVERGHLIPQCPLALNHLGNLALTELSRTALVDESTK
jgi:hypothetical protein